MRQRRGRCCRSRAQLGYLRLVRLVIIFFIVGGGEYVARVWLLPRIPAKWSIGVWDDALDAGVCKAIMSDASSFYCMPSVVLIGGQKCGSTALANLLLRHPQVRGRTGGNAFTASRFKQDYLTRIFRRTRVRWDEYLEQEAFRMSIDDLRRGVITFEKSPDYLASEIAAREMRALMPSAKLVVILRDPVRRAYSAFQWQRAKGRIRRSSSGIEVVSSLWIDLFPWSRGDVDCDNPAFFDEYLENAELVDYAKMDSIIGKGMYESYARQLEYWIEQFGDRSRIEVVLLEELSVNRTRTLNSLVEDFMKLKPWDDRWAPTDLSSSEANRGAYRKSMSSHARDILKGAYAHPNHELKVLLPDLEWRIATHWGK